MLDASAAVSALLNSGAARKAAMVEQLHAPHLLDIEVASALRRLAARGVIDEANVTSALSAHRQLGITRYAMTPLLDRVWGLRANLSAYDATYVALAEILECPLLTADVRLGRAAAHHCVVSVVPG